MTVEAAGFIDDIDPTQPPGTDNFSEGDDHLRNFKKSVQDSFPNISGAMTATEAELNIMDGVTATTAELNYVDGVTSDIQTQLDTKALITDVDDLSGVTDAPTARTNLGLGSIALLSIIKPSTDLIDTITTDGSQSIGSGATWTPAQGFYNMVSLNVSTSGRLELFISAAWRSGVTSVSGLVFFDGVNMRLKNSGGSAQSTYWQRFDG